MTDEYITYALVPAPPKWELQEYISAYIESRDNKYLSWFLHYYENTLNNNVREYMRKYFMPEHFADLKQAYIIGLLKALQNYDVSIGTDFIIYKERYAEREVLDYIRSARTGYTAQSIGEYAKLRQAMAIWDKYDRSYANETLEAIAEEMQESVANVKEILLGGLLNENMVELYRHYAEDDGEETAEEIAVDNFSDPYHLYVKYELYSHLWEAFDKLNYEEQAMLSKRYGFCRECHNVFYMDYTDLDEYGYPKKKPIKPMLYTDIATDHEYSSANTAKSKCDKAIDKLRKAVKDFI